MVRFNIGDSFETTVVAVTDSTVFVDLSAKSEGVIDVAEFKDDEGNVSVKEGDKPKVCRSASATADGRIEDSSAAPVARSTSQWSPRRSI